MHRLVREALHRTRHDINPQTGLIPVEIHLENCNACGLCIDACPEPYGLMPIPEGADFELQDPRSSSGGRLRRRRLRSGSPRGDPLPKTEPMVLKGTYASAVGAILAGCRHVYGYRSLPPRRGRS